MTLTLANLNVVASSPVARPDDDPVPHGTGPLGRVRPSWPPVLAAAVFLILGSGGCTRPPAASPAPATAEAPAPATAVATRPSSTAGRTARLTVRVTGLRNHKGQLIFGVFRSADGFPNKDGKSVNWQVRDADADPAEFTADLPPGVYAASVLHDENRSGDMDKNAVGIPLEGYGVTNNPKPKLRAATFGEATFTLPPEGATLTISVQYF